MPATSGEVWCQENTNIILKTLNMLVTDSGEIIVMAESEKTDRWPWWTNYWVEEMTWIEENPFLAH